MTGHASELREPAEYIKVEDQKEAHEEVGRKLEANRARAEAYMEEECSQIAAPLCSNCNRPLPPSGYLCECQPRMQPTATSGRDETGGGGREAE